MGYAKPFEKAAWLLCAVLLAVGCAGAGSNVVRAFGEEPAHETPGTGDKPAPRTDSPQSAEPSPANAAEGIAIDETNFPDAVFRAIVQNIAGGDLLTQDVVDATTELDIADKGIASLKGIEHFTALVRLDCSYNRLTSIDLSKNTNLKSVNPVEQIVSIPNAGESIDLQAIDPNVDPTKIPESYLVGAEIEGTVLSGYTVGTMLSYDYDTGLKVGSSSLYMYVIVEPMGASELVITTDDAGPVPTGEFEVAKDGTLIVKRSGKYVVRMASYVEESKDRILIESGASPTIKLDSLNLHSTAGSSIEIRPGAGDVKLYVQDYVSLKPQTPGAGILKNNEATLTVAADPLFPGRALLEATAAGHAYPGIGASGAGEQGKVTACENIVIEGLNVEAVGSERSAGIGGGFGITEVSGITLDKCTVNAQGGKFAAGIGSGWIGDGGISVSNITIKGGKVHAAGSFSSAGIGSGLCAKGPAQVSDIHISNSTVASYGKSMGAGIGAGACVEGSAVVKGITIERSKVEATGDNVSAGIGSGWAKGDNLVSRIVIDRSEVKAQGGFGAPGMGSSYSDTGNSELDDVRIENSFVRSEGGTSRDGSTPIRAADDEGVARPENIIGAGAGIGSGFSDKGDSTAKNIVVSNLSWVYAAAGDDAHGGGASAGIGSGPAWRGTSTASGIVVQEGQVFAQGGTTTASGMGPAALPGIGAGSGMTRTMQNNAIEPGEGAWSRAWKADTKDEINQLYDHPFVDYSRERTSLDDADKRYMAIAVWRDEMLSCTGSDDGYRYEKGLLIIEGNGTYTVDMTPPGVHDPEALSDEAEAFDSNEAAPKSVDLFSPTPLGIVVADGASPTVVLNYVSIDESDVDGACAFAIEDGALDTTVLLSGENVLASGSGRAGIEKSAGSGKLTVRSTASADEADGSLEALGGDGAAGIGGGKAETGSSDTANIEIAGGTVKAVAGHAHSGRSAAGIGGGCTLDRSGNADAHSIVVSGGTVSAQGSSSNFGAGAGIGGGTPGPQGHANASDITVSGGTVKAVGGNNGAAGIGSGSTLSAGESVARRITVSGGSVEATGGNNAAGIGSGFAQGDGNESRAENIVVSGGTVKATAGPLGGAAGIGSGQANGSLSIARDIVISGGSVEAIGATGAFSDGESYAVMGGAGIGSGCSSPYGSNAAAAESRAEGIVVSGGTVTATGGSNSPGIGSGTAATDYAFVGSSTATDIRLTGGTVTAVGGLTHAQSSRDPLEPGQIDSAELIGDLVQLPAVGTGLAASRTCENAAIAPAAGLMANAWRGASAESAVQFLKDAVEATSITEAKDAYLRAEFSSAPGIVPAEPAKPAPLHDAASLAPTGDSPVPLAIAGSLFAIAAATLTAAVVALARKRRNSC